MFVSEKISQLRQELANFKNQKIAFVPTMGALHEGHIALVKEAAKIADKVVVSIFVNKTQFNDPQDFAKYPKTLEQDLELLKNSGATHVFAPEDLEIFSADFSFTVQVDSDSSAGNSLTNCLCGAARKGHFSGVALILTKLFNIVKPQIAIFGEKDFQQVAVVKKLVKDLNFDIEIVTAKTQRQLDGLALSSRNKRLSEASRIKAANIFRIMNELRQELLKIRQSNQEITLEKILAKKSAELLQNGFEKIDYLEIRQENNLSLVEKFPHAAPARIFVAAFIDGVRLIDNLAL